MISSNKIFRLRQLLFIPVTQFTGYEQVAVTPAGTNSAPTIDGSGAANGSYSQALTLGISSDANSATLTTGTAARTGITGINASTFTGTPIGANSLIASAGNGVPITKEIGTTGIVGVMMDTDGDDIKHFMRIPTNWDRDNNLRIRMIFTSESADDTDTVTWKFLYGLLNPGTDAIAAPSTALDTALVAHTVAGTAKTLERSSAAGVLLGGTIPDADLYWTFLCERDGNSGLGEDITLLGVEFEYTVKMGRGNLVSEPDAWEA